jgi:hypothetical protein
MFAQVTCLITWAGMASLLFGQVCLNSQAVFAFLSYYSTIYPRQRTGCALAIECITTYNFASRTNISVVRSSLLTACRMTNALVVACSWTWLSRVIGSVESCSLRHSESGVSCRLDLGVIFVAADGMRVLDEQADWWPPWRLL